MSQRMKINSQRIIALRRSPRQLQILLAYGTLLRDKANADFYATASTKEKKIQDKYSRSDTPYDVEARTGNDRVRVYVQTASLPARRHEASSRGSSLLRAVARGNG